MAMEEEFEPIQTEARRILSFLFPDSLQSFIL